MTAFREGVELMFADRRDAGRKLAKKLKKYKRDRPVILALPRGGVEVGYEVAKALKYLLDVLLVHKIGAPYNPEFAVGAVAQSGIVSLDTDKINAFGISEEKITKQIKIELQKIKLQIAKYRKNKKLPSLRNKTVIIVDDGIATGETVMAAIKYVTKAKPKKIILAAPVCAYETLKRLAPQVKAVVTLIAPRSLSSISQYYRQFPQTSDEIVMQLLKNSISQ